MQSPLVSQRALLAPRVVGKERKKVEVNQHAISFSWARSAMARRLANFEPPAIFFASSLSATPHHAERSSRLRRTASASRAWRCSGPGPQRASWTAACPFSRLPCSTSPKKKKKKKWKRFRPSTALLFPLFSFARLLSFGGCFVCDRAVVDKRTRVTSDSCCPPPEACKRQRPSE